jgi:nucleotide-binding universal stress UspA family protein
MTTIVAGPRDVALRNAHSEILVAVDFTTAAWSVVPLAVDLAARCSMPIGYVHVDTSSPWVTEAIGGRLRLLAAPAGQMVDVDVVPGTDVPEAIQGLLASRLSAVVALATHGRSGIAELTFGSVCEQLLVTYDATVLAVGPRFDAARHAEVHRVVTCVDAAAPSPALLDEGVAWAEALDVPMTVLSVSGNGRSRPGEDETYHLINDIFDRLPITSVPVSADVIDDPDPADAIVSYADRRDGTLLLLATHARRPLVRAVTTSVTRRVAREAHCGMLLRRATSASHVDLDPLTGEDWLGAEELQDDRSSGRE